MSDHTSTRRRVLQGIAASGLTVGFVGTGSAGSATTYVVTGGSRRKLESAGFSVTRELAGGSVTIVSGPEDAEGELDSVGGVSGVTEDFEVDFAEPIAEDHITDDAAFTDLQWDKEITDTFEAHHHATGEGTRIVVADTGVDGTHQDLAGNFNEELSVSFVNGGEEGPHIGDSGDHGTHARGPRRRPAASASPAPPPTPNSSPCGCSARTAVRSRTSSRARSTPPTSVPTPRTSASARGPTSHEPTATACASRPRR